MLSHRSYINFQIVKQYIHHQMLYVQIVFDEIRINFFIIFHDFKLLNF